MITVFTPVYNRAYIINILYESLLIQNFKDFEWLIVDDGSTDNIQEVINNFINENKINIRYFVKENGGKHTAINYGVNKAIGNLFFIVDSDDYLTSDALQILNSYYEEIKDNRQFAGVSGIRVYKNGKRIGGELKFNVLDTSFINLRYKLNIKGDLAEAYKTSILKKFPFPEIKEEKFCTEALIWNRIANEYHMRFFNKGIYICEYLQDGLSANVFKIRKNSPKGITNYYSELSKLNIPFHQKIKAISNYWRFSIYNKISFKEKLSEVSLFYSLIALPIILTIIINDKIKNK